MRWPEVLEPARMERVAVVAPTDRLRSVLVAVADAGVVQIERVGDKARGPASEAWERARRAQVDDGQSVPVLELEPPDLATLEREGPARGARGGGRARGDQRKRCEERCRLRHWRDGAPRLPLTP